MMKALKISTVEKSFGKVTVKGSITSLEKKDEDNDILRTSKKIL